MHVLSLSEKFASDSAVTVDHGQIETKLERSALPSPSTDIVHYVLVGVPKRDENLNVLRIGVLDGTPRYRKKNQAEGI